MFTKNQKVILRPLQPQDLERFFKYRSDPEICQYQNFMVKDFEKARAFIEAQKNIDLKQPDTWMQVAIAESSNNMLVGDCAVKYFPEENRIAEIGCTISGENQRKGFGKAAIGLLLQFLFEQRNVHKVIAHVDHRNMPSLKLVRSLGFSQDGLLRENFFDDGSWHDEYVFSILEKELAK